jgi:hypothetical protein
VENPVSFLLEEQKSLDVFMIQQTQFCFWKNKKESVVADSFFVTMKLFTPAAQVL